RLRRPRPGRGLLRAPRPALRGARHRSTAGQGGPGDPRHEHRALQPEMSTEIPTELLPLLESTAVALVSTIGPRGEPQTTPLWFLWEDGRLRLSLVEGRQKLKNLRR